MHADPTWWRRRAPEVATARVTGPVIGTLYLMGGLAVLAVVALPSGAVGTPAPLVVIGPLALVAGAGVVGWGHRLARPLLHLLVVLGTGLITTVVAAAPNTVVALALSSIYAFVAVAAFFLFAPPVALAYLVSAIAADTVTLAVRGVPAGALVALGLVTATIGLVVATLVRRASSASLDGLTGLANRRGFDDALDEAIRATERTGAPFAVALVDVDHFKSINDRHGHGAGDDLLRTVARSWAPLVPRTALLARHGGDEFALLLPATTGPAALRTIEQLRPACADVPLSAGIAQRRAGEDASQLMRRADTALYRAKAEGRGRSALFDDVEDGGQATAQRAG